LGFWVKAYKKKLSGRPIQEGAPDDERIRELERRNRELEMEVDFLRKASAYFAREHR
jgi:transposase